MIAYADAFIFTKVSKAILTKGARESQLFLMSGCQTGDIAFLYSTLSSIFLFQEGTKRHFAHEN